MPSTAVLPTTAALLAIGNKITSVSNTILLIQMSNPVFLVLKACSNSVCVPCILDVLSNFGIE